MARSNGNAVLVLAVAVLVLCGCSMLEPEPLEAPVVNLRGLEPEAMGINSQVFRARLNLFNPNAVALRVSGGEVQLRFGGVRAARGRTLGPFSIAAGETADVDIRITTNLLRDGAALFAALAEAPAGQGLEYELEGHVNVDRRGFDRMPINARGTVGAAAGRSTPPDPSPPASGSIL